MKYPGPVRIDPSLAKPRSKPLANEPDAQSGPTVAPGEYQVDLEVGSETQVSRFSIVKDPRLSTTPDDFARQFALLAQLNDKLSALNGAVNRIRRVNGQLRALAEHLGDPHTDLAGKAKWAEEQLTAIETVLVDVNRESPRDVLRHPAGLNDTLVDMINTVAMADMAPTAPADAVSRETMARVDVEIARLDALMAGDIADINVTAAQRSVAYVAADPRNLTRALGAATSMAQCEIKL
jgi:hypothetical protein